MRVKQTHTPRQKPVVRPGVPPTATMSTIVIIRLKLNSAKPTAAFARARA